MKYLLGGAVALGLVAGQAVAADKLKPFVLASSGSGDVAATVSSTKDKLTGAGFEVVGDYSPYGGAHVIVVTNSELKSVATKSEHGGFGAVQRVSVTKNGGNVEVAYTNPTYWAAVFRLKSKLSGVADKFSSALGKQNEFGSKKGLTAKKLKKYHYMFGMPYFDDADKVGKASSHKAAVGKVEKGLAGKKGGVSKVYRVDLGGDQTLFGVALTKGSSGDKHIMDIVDTGSPKATAHLPYEVLVSGKNIYALNGKFRIASSFPDLGMGTFGKISDAPGDIEDALEEMSK